MARRAGSHGTTSTLRTPSPDVESFNARLRDELPNGEIFYTLKEAQIVIESWRRHDDAVRPRASLGYRPPASEVFVRAQTLGQLRSPDWLGRLRASNKAGSVALRGDGETAPS